VSDFGETSHPVARKDHRCEACFGRIRRGEKHVHYKGIWDGDWQNWRMHNECYDSFDNDGLAEGFTPGGCEWPERIKILEKEGATK